VDPLITLLLNSGNSSSLALKCLIAVGMGSLIISTSCCSYLLLWVNNHPGVDFDLIHILVNSW
jgi:hypothetical protein